MKKFRKWMALKITTHTGYRKRKTQRLKSSFSVVGGRVDSLLTNNNEKVVRLEPG